MKYGVFQTTLTHYCGKWYSFWLNEILNHDEVTPCSILSCFYIFYYTNSSGSNVLATLAHHYWNDDNAILCWVWVTSNALMWTHFIFFSSEIKYTTNLRQKIHFERDVKYPRFFFLQHNEGTLLINVSAKSLWGSGKMSTDPTIFILQYSVCSATRVWTFSDSCTNLNQRVFVGNLNT